MIEHDVDPDASYLILDDTSEFVRNITSESALPTRQSIGRPALPVLPVNSDIIMSEIKPDVEAMQEAPISKIEAVYEDPYVEERQEVGLAETSRPDALLEGTAGEMLVSQGVGATLSLLRQQGLVKPMTSEETLRDQQYKDKQAWLKNRRADQQRALEAKQRSKGSGAAKDQRTRELENRQREKDQAQRDLELFKDYKPNIDIKYNDEFGRSMTAREAWKYVPS